MDMNADPGKSCRPSLFHNLEPDYAKKPYRIPREKKRRIAGKLSFLYGRIRAPRVLKEIERVMGVYHAHKSQHMIEWEKTFDPRRRFTQEDAVLITYGDLITDLRMKPLQILSAISRKYFRGVFNTIHILPFFPYSSDRGFAVTDYRQVDPDLGTWDDINSLKDDFKLMFDGVFNHTSSRSYWFQEFLNGNRDYADFFTVFSPKKKIPEKKLKMLLRPRTSHVLTEFRTYYGKKLVWTTFSPDHIDLNFRNPRVLVKMIDILLIYVRRGADIIRLDAVTYLWNRLGTTGAHLEETHTIIRLMRDILDAVAPHVALITETNVPHEDNITYFGNGSDEAQMVYNFALPPLILHTFQTMNARKLTRWAMTLKNPSDTATYFNFLDSHDGIGVLGARNILTDGEISAMARHAADHGGLISCRKDQDGGESIYEINITSFSAINPEDAGEPVELQAQRYIAARSIPLVLIGVPGIYLHGLLGSKNDIDAVREDNDKRSINRDILNRDELIRSLEDRNSMTHRVSRMLSHLVRKRIQEKAFHPHAPQEVLDLPDSLFGVIRRSGDGREIIITLVNVTESAVPLELDLRARGIDPVDFEEILSGRDVRARDHMLFLEMKPYEVCWLKAQVRYRE